ncbi:MAG: aminoacyl--tRNA ligase-related protein [Candidatus Njordarchaeales archaeon]
MVKFEGVVEYILSKEVPEDFNEFFEKDLLGEINEILKKGARNNQEAAKVLTFEVSNNVIRLKIESGSRVRLHHAALRIKNYLAPILGKKFKIGIREIVLKDAVIILDGSLRVSTTLPFVKSVIVKDNKTLVNLAELTESELKRPIIDRLLKLLDYKEKRARWGGKIEHWRLIKRSSMKEPKFRDDPNTILEKIGWVKRYSTGQWLYTPPITHLLRKFEELFIETVLKPLGFVEAIFPKMNPLEIGLKTGHLKGTPHQMFFASQPISYNLEDFDEWVDYISVLEEADPEILRRHIKPPNYFVCFAQCEPFYWFFGGEIIDKKEIPIKWFDRSGPSFRWESGGLRGLERVVEFHRIEIVWLGEPEQVINIRNELLKRYEYFMDKVLDLEWRWAWVTPFYLVHAGEIEEEEEKEIDINQPGTIDFEAWLPYKGDRDDQHAWLEIGNISIHGTKYSEPFRIKHQLKDKIIWTGCSGFGLQRWFLAFLAQKGFDPDNWPEEVRKKITRPPRSVRMVTYPKGRDSEKLLDEIESLLSKLHPR